MKTLLKQNGYDIYLITFSILTLIAFTGNYQEYLMPVLIGIGILFVLAKKSIFYVIPIPFFVQMGYTDLRANVPITTTYGIIFVILVVSDILHNRRIKRIGKLTIPLIVFVVASMLTHINSPDLFTTFVGFILFFVVLGLYLYFLNTISPNDDNFRLVSKMIMYISLVVSFEMMYVIYESGDLATTVIRTRQIDLGWENLNIIIYANLMSMPLIAYLIHKSKIKFFYMVAAIISMIGIFLTLSRSSLLTLGVFILFLVPTMFLISKQKKLLIVQGVVFLLMLGLTIFIVESQYELISQYLEAIQSRDLTYVDDRLGILRVAWEQFKLHPLFGSGGIYSSIAYLEGTTVNYHNTLAQVSTLGVTGIIAFFYLFLLKTKVIIDSHGSFKWFALILIFITAFVNGALQPMYFYTTYLVYLFLVIACIEVTLDNKEKPTS